MRNDPVPGQGIDVSFRPARQLAAKSMQQCRRRRARLGCTTSEAWRASIQASPRWSGRQRCRWSSSRGVRLDASGWVLPLLLAPSVLLPAHLFKILLCGKHGAVQSLQKNVPPGRAGRAAAPTQGGHRFEVYSPIRGARMSGSVTRGVYRCPLHNAGPGLASEDDCATGLRCSAPLQVQASRTGIPANWHFRGTAA